MRLVQGLRRGDHWTLADLRSALERTPDAVVVGDADRLLVGCSKAAAALSGLSPEELVGHPVGRLATGGMADLHRQLYDVALTAGSEVVIREAAIDLPGGGHALIDVGFVTISSDHGPLVVMTVRPSGEEDEQGRMFRGLLEAAPDGMVIVDERGEIQLVNAQAERLFGYARTELVGQPVELLVPDRFAGVHHAFRAGYVVDPSARPMGLAGDLYGRRKDGSEVPIEVMLSPLETDTGLLVSAAVRDVSERQRLQAESDRVKDEFFATVSHELRTPLTSLIGYGELLSDLEDLSPQASRFLSVMMRSAERELRLVDDLLTLVAIEDAGLSIRFVEVDLEQVVRDAVEAARPRAEEAGVGLAVETPGTAAPLLGDRDRLGQVLDNLLSNAVKFTPSGGQVRVTLRLEPGVAEVEVADTGDGVGVTDSSLLFEKLFRAPTAVAQQTPGAGLGLTIARAIVEAHHGSIVVVPGESSGTTFSVRLPRDAAVTVD